MLLAVLQIKTICSLLNNDDGRLRKKSVYKIGKEIFGREAEEYLKKLRLDIHD